MTEYFPWFVAGGVAQLSILIASALVPQVLDWKKELGKLPLLLRQLVWVHGAFIVLTIGGLAIVSLINARELATGTPLARSLCAFTAIFWGTRLAVQWFYFSPDAYLTHPSLKFGYHLLTAAFIGLTLLYGWGAVQPLDRFR